METTNDNISRLLEMLDNPSAFTEQEIRDIINSDDEAREAYRLMVAAKQAPPAAFRLDENCRFVHRYPTHNRHGLCSRPHSSPLKDS